MKISYFISCMCVGLLVGPMAKALLPQIGQMVPEASHSKDMLSAPEAISNESDEFNFMDEADPFAPDAEEKLKAFDQEYEQSSGESSVLHPQDGEDFSQYYTPLMRVNEIEFQDRYDLDRFLNQDLNLYLNDFIMMGGDLTGDEVKETEPSPELAWLRDGSAGANTSECFRWDCNVFVFVNKAEQLMYLFVNQKLHAIWKVSTGAVSSETPALDLHPNGRIYDRYESRKFPGGSFGKLGNMPYAIFLKGGFAIHGTGRGNWNRLGTKASHGCVRLHPYNARYFNRIVRHYGIEDVWVTIR
jgi:hypothetical protein